MNPELTIFDRAFEWVWKWMLTPAAVLCCIAFSIAIGGIALAILYGAGYAIIHGIK
jgi:hypothetical protein